MHASQDTPCRLCNGELRHRFNRLVLGRHDVRYHECTACGSLQTERPHWLDEAYAPAEHNLDTGAVQRNLDAFAFCFAFARLFGVRTAVDHGAGVGLLCRFLRDHGIDCRAHDLYSKPQFALDFTTPHEGAPDLAIAFEVFEHLPEPARDLDELFALRPKYLLVSTDLYEGQGSDWWYLAAEHGQHVFFYSPQAMHFIAQHHGYGVTMVGGKILFFRKDLPDVENLIVAAQTVLSGWVFQAVKSYVFLLPAPGAQADHDRIAALMQAEARGLAASTGTPR